MTKVGNAPEKPTVAQVTKDISSNTAQQYAINSVKQALAKAAQSKQESEKY
jgi:hypothetical protein